MIEFTALGHWDAQFFYRFDNFFHPFVEEMSSKLNREALAGLTDPVWQKSLETANPKTDPTHDFFHQIYQPKNGQLVQIDSFPKSIDVAEHGPYSNYNWELFFHIPLTIAVHLSKSQRFAEAQRWFHYIFDPTSNDQSVEPRKRFWKFLAFRDSSAIGRIEDIVRILSSPRSDLKPDEQLLQDQFLNGYDVIRDKPFQPHAVARTRHLAYQYCVVMKYLDNLIAWGDHLFQQDTIETINEATQIYVLAANVLGQRRSGSRQSARSNRNHSLNCAKTVSDQSEMHLSSCRGRSVSIWLHPATLRRRLQRQKEKLSSASAVLCTSAFRPTRNFSATGILSLTGCSRFDTV